MRILFLAPQPFFRARGTPFNVRALVRVLCECGHRVDLLTYPFGDDVTMAGLRVLRVARVPGIRDVKVGPSPAKVPLDGLMAWAALRRSLFRRYDVVHAVEEAAFIAHVLRRIRGLPYICDMDSHISDQLRYSGTLSDGAVLRWVERWERGVLNRAECTITVCKALTDVASRMAPDTPVFQIEDVPVDDGGPATPLEASALRRRLGLQDRRLVVYTGNLESYQGVDLLVDGFALGAAKDARATLILVGGGEDQIAVLRQRAERQGIGDRVVFAGHRPPEEVPAYLAAADCLVSPRRSGVNTPLKIFTYMRSGRPIVATDALTHTQVLDRTCAVLAPADPEGIAAGILEVLADPDHGAELAERAMKRLQERFSREVFARKVRTTYEWLEERLGEKRRSAAGGTSGTLDAGS